MTHIRTRRVATSLALTLSFRPVMHAQSFTRTARDPQSQAADQTLPLATEMVKHPNAAMPTGGADLNWSRVECDAVALREQGRYDDELSTLDLAAGLLLRDLAQHPSRTNAPLAVEYLNQLALRMDGANRPDDAVRLLRAALAIAQPDHKLYEKYYLLTVQLDLAHALAQSGDKAAANALCTTLSAETLTPSDIRYAHAGNLTVAQARKQLFCADPTSALTLLQAQLVLNPTFAEPHKILSDYALTTHHWNEAATEYHLYLNAPEFQSREAATTAH